MGKQKYDRVYNFSSGPAALPTPVLEQVRDELLNYRGTGVSVMEMSHRSKAFDEILAHATAAVHKLLGLGDDYAVLFLHGGASLQFAMLPMNFAEKGKPVDVVHTGTWTARALEELSKGYDHRIVATGEASGFKALPKLSEADLSPNASYVHMCSNNTIEGTQWKSFPDTGKVPLVVDMSSDLMARVLDFSRFDVIFAGAQKNLGPSGVGLVVIRKELAERGPKNLATMLQYRTHIKNESRYNTPPAFGIYVCGLVTEWVLKQGGISALEKSSRDKARLLYETLDSIDIYKCPTPKADRSDMNIVWRIKPDSTESESLEKKLVGDATAAGLVELKGHRLVGGLRASIYNAMPVEGVQALCDFLREWARKNG